MLLCLLLLFQLVAVLVISVLVLLLSRLLLWGGFVVLEAPAMCTLCRVLPPPGCCCCCSRAALAVDSWLKMGWSRAAAFCWPKDPPDLWLIGW